jgi:hypothetical protein
VDGTHIREPASRCDNGQRRSDRAAEEEQSGAFFGGLSPLLRLGVEVEEYGLAAGHIVNHVIQGTHHDIRIHMGVVRQQCPDVTEPHVFIVGTVIPGQYQPTMTGERPMIQDIPDTAGHAQAAGRHGRHRCTRVVVGNDTIAPSSLCRRNHPQ